MNEGKMTVFLERLMIFVAVVGPFANLPQLLKIWIKKKTNGVSLVSWILFSILSIVWLIYGIVKKDKYIIIALGITLILQLLIVIGTVIY
jgi:MtN3 and saliva related transmembrane protein